MGFGARNLFEFRLLLDDLLLNVLILLDPKMPILRAFACFRIPSSVERGVFPAPKLTDLYGSLKMSTWV